MRWMLGDPSVGGFSSSFLQCGTSGCSFDRRLLSELVLVNPTGRGAVSWITAGFINLKSFFWIHTFLLIKYLLLLLQAESLCSWMNSKHACCSCSRAHTRTAVEGQVETDEWCDAMAAGRRLDVTHGLVVGRGRRRWTQEVLEDGPQSRVWASGM